MPIASRAHMLTFARKVTPPFWAYHAVTAASAPFPIANDSAANSTIFRSFAAYPFTSPHTKNTSSTTAALGLAASAKPPSSA